MDAAASVSGERRLPATVYAMGFSLRKRPVLRRFLPECAVRFVKSVEDVPPGATLATWGLGETNVDRSRNEVVQIEDGFLRSVGLGAELVAPLSWTVDTTGIYYDASRPSDLERLLEQGSFSAQDARASCSSACGDRQRWIDEVQRRCPDVETAGNYAARHSGSGSGRARRIDTAGRAGHQAQYRSVAGRKKQLSRRACDL